MLSIFDPIRNMNFAAVLIRLVIACTAGALIGIERSYKNKAAGFRTHILVALAACTASMTGLYLYLNAGLPTDMSRIGAQVITGLGFIGGGTIVVTRDQTVKGLTTAAGMWTSGIIGLAIGAGFYEGGLAALVMVLLVETAAENFRSHIQKPTKFNLVLSYYERHYLDQIMRFFKDRNASITNLKITGTNEGEKPVWSALMTVSCPNEVDPGTFAKQVREMEGIISAEIIENA